MRMKPNSIVVNIARGSLLDEKALAAALTAGKLGGAILDVFETEPLPPESELWGMENVFITPHISGVDIAREICEEFIANYEAITANVREVLNVGAFISRGRQFCVELVTEFHVFRTPPEGSPIQWKEGDLKIMNQIVLYDLDEKGRFQRIRIFHHRYLDPSKTKHS